ncbi:MAG TPA: hypothetical protein VJR26_07435 [Candidatus Acidoferrales bacterium]|nr:hypothetical protein [Candidatus Acidoferrales bacterium]
MSLCAALAKSPWVDLTVNATSNAPISLSKDRSKFRTALILAVVVDALQLIVFPAFVEGAFSAADDVVDLLVAATLIPLLGWHWEFLPSFAAKLIPGVDLVPFWTLAVANVYRKWKQTERQSVIDISPPSNRP